MKRILLLTAVVWSLIGCSSSSDNSDVIELTSENPTLHYGENFQIKATSETTITYKSENEYHATVSSSGLVSAKRIGETNITLTNGSDTKKLKVTVTPEYNTYPEPALVFGTYRSLLKKELGDPDGETDTGMLYSGYSAKAPELMCLFDEADKLKAYAVMVKTAYSEELGGFLTERYALASVDEEDFTIFFVNGLDENTVTMAVGSSLYNTSYWMVMYFPYTFTRGYQAVDHLELMKSVDELMEAVR